MFSVILYVGTLKLIHEVVWSHVPIISSLIYDSLLHLFVYFNLMLMHVSSVVSDLCEPMDCSSPGPSLHGISHAKNTGVGIHFLLQWIFPAQGSNPHLLHLCFSRWILYHECHITAKPITNIRETTKLFKNPKGKRS